MLADAQVSTPLAREFHARARAGSAPAPRGEDPREAPPASGNFRNFIH